MGSEVIKRIILEKYKDNYLVLGNKNTEDCCGVTLDEALKNIERQMIGCGKKFMQRIYNDGALYPAICGKDGDGFCEGCSQLPSHKSSAQNTKNLGKMGDKGEDSTVQEDKP